MLHHDESVTINLTLKGFDLGTRYQSRFGSLNLWYQHHKSGLFGLVISLLFGLLGGVVSHFVISRMEDEKESKPIQVIIPSDKPPTIEAVPKSKN